MSRCPTPRPAAATGATTVRNRGTLVGFPDGPALAAAAAELVAARAAAAVRERGRFLLVLPGGSTPVPLFQVLARQETKTPLPWDRTHVFWGDERCLPADHVGCNTRIAQQVLLARVPVPAANVHLPPVDPDDPVRTAARWAADLEEFFGVGAAPAFDLVILGIGTDGHTASLFPGDPALDEARAWTAPVPARGSPAVPRVTLTLAVLNQARCVLFLAGQEKRAVVHAVRTGGAARDAYPAAMVQPVGELFWYLEEGAVQ